MLTLDLLAERRIREAQDSGAFDDLPGAGAPLALDDDALVPHELRAAYRILKNSGYLPPELEAHGEIRSLEQMLRGALNDDQRSALLSRLNFLLARRATGRREGDFRIESAYFETVSLKLAQNHPLGSTG
jgi:hypothetical protein